MDVRTLMCSKNHYRALLLNFVVFLVIHFQTSCTCSERARQHTLHGLQVIVSSWGGGGLDVDEWLSGRML